MPVDHFEVMGKKKRELGMPARGEEYFGTRIFHMVMND
jgi:hypothetical protein